MSKLIVLVAATASALQVSPTRPGSVPDMLKSRGQYPAEIAKAVKLSDDLLAVNDEVLSEEPDTACVTVYDKEVMLATHRPCILLTGSRVHVARSTAGSFCAAASAVRR